MIKFSCSFLLITILLIASNLVHVKCRHMPIRMLFERFQESYAENHPGHLLGRQFGQTSGSQSQAQSSALTNAVNIAGIPITNTVSGGGASSTDSGYSGHFQEQFGLGGFGLNVGLSSEKSGSGISASHKPGQIGLHIGGLDLGFTNNGGLYGAGQNTQTQSSATASATGQSVQSSSESKTQSNSFSGLSGLVNVQNTLSHSQAQAHAQQGQTTANAGSTGLIQAPTSYVQNIVPPPNQQKFQQPGFGNGYNSFLINPFLHYGNPHSGAPYSIPQQQFGYQSYPGQPFPNQFNNPQSNWQQYPYQQQLPYQSDSQHYGYQPYPYPQYQGYYGQHALPFNSVGANNNYPLTQIYPSPNQNGFVQQTPQKNTGDSILINGQTNVNVPKPVVSSGNGQSNMKPIPQSNNAQTTVLTPITLPTPTIKPAGHSNNIPSIAENVVDEDAPGAEFGIDVRIDEDTPKNGTKANIVKRSARRHRHHGSPQSDYRFPSQSFNGFPNQYQQANTNTNGFAQYQDPFFNQNAGTNTFSNNNQNPFGQFQNTGGSSISSNLANNGQSGQLSASNTNLENFNTAQGSGSKNVGQTQSANFDQLGNLQLSNANTGTQFTMGSDGQRQQANGASNAHLQNQFGTTDSGSQSLTEDFIGPNGEKGTQTSSSAFSSNVNNGNGNIYGSEQRVRRAVAAEGQFYAQQGYYRLGSGGRFRRATAEDNVSYPKDEVQNPGTSPVESGKKSANGTALDSRFGLLGGLVSQAIGGLLRGQGGQQFNEGYYPQQGGFYNERPYYPEQGPYYPQQGPYYPQGGQFYPQQGNYQPGFGGRFRRATEEVAISSPKSDEDKIDVKSQHTSNDENGKKNTELETRFGLLGGRGPLTGFVREVIGDIVERQRERQGEIGQQQQYTYIQEPYNNPQLQQQADYLNQGPRYNDQTDPLQPNLEGRRFKRNAEGALVFPDEVEKLKDATTTPKSETKETLTKKGNDTDVETRFFFGGRGPLGGVVREAIGQLLGRPNDIDGERHYGRPSYGYGRPPPPPHGGRPYHEGGHYHPRPDYPSHHHMSHGPPHHIHYPEPSNSYQNPEQVYYPDDNSPPTYPQRPSPHHEPYRPNAIGNQPSYQTSPNINNLQNPEPHGGVQQSNTNGAAQSQNQNQYSNQNSGSNTYSNNVNSEQGQFQNTGGSSISSNIANNGQSGQVSSSNTGQQSYHTAQESGDKTTGQSQSANFDQNGNLGLTSSNTGAQHTIGANGDEKTQSTGSANAHQQTQHGTSDSTSQTLSETFNQNGVMGSKATGQSASAIQGADGSVSSSNSGSETQTFDGPNGIKGTSSSSHSSSQNVGAGGNLGTSSSSSSTSGSGFGGSQSFSNSGAFNAAQFGGVGSQTNSFSGSNGFGSNSGSNAGSNSYNLNRPTNSGLVFVP